MGRVKNLEALKSPPLREVWALSETPKYDLSTMLVKLQRGYLLDSSLHDLMFNSCVRGGFLDYTYMKIGFDSPYLRLLCFFTGLGELSLQS
jgi:hypothetical protein